MWRWISASRPGGFTPGEKAHISFWLGSQMSLDYLFNITDRNEIVLADLLDHFDLLLSWKYSLMMETENYHKRWTSVSNRRGWSPREGLVALRCETTATVFWILQQSKFQLQTPPNLRSFSISDLRTFRKQMNLNNKCLETHTIFRWVNGSEVRKRPRKSTAGRLHRRRGFDSNVLVSGFHLGPFWCTYWQLTICILISDLRPTLRIVTIASVGECLYVSCWTVYSP